MGAGPAFQQASGVFGRNAPITAAKKSSWLRKKTLRRQLHGAALGGELLRTIANRLLFRIPQLQKTAEEGGCRLVLGTRFSDARAGFPDATEFASEGCNRGHLPRSARGRLAGSVQFEHQGANSGVTVQVRLARAVAPRLGDDLCREDRCEDGNDHAERRGAEESGPRTLAPRWSFRFTHTGAVVAGPPAVKPCGDAVRLRLFAVLESGIRLRWSTHP